MSQTGSSSRNSSLLQREVKGQPAWMRFLNEILNVVQNKLLPTRSTPRVGMLSSLRVSGILLEQYMPSFSWIFMMPHFSFKTILNLSLKHIPIYPFTLRGCRPESISFESRWLIKKTSLQEESLWNFEGMNIFKLIETRLHEIVIYEFPILIAWIKQCEEMICKLNLDLLVLDEDVTPFHKALVQVAQRRFIPSIVIQHGITGQKRGYSPLSASTFAAWGEISRKRLMEWGVPSNKIEVTGYPPLSRPFTAISSETRSEIMRQLGFDSTKKVILYAPPRERFVEHGLFQAKLNPEEARELFFAVLDSFLKFSDCVLIVKIHPGGDKKYFESLLREKGQAQNRNIFLTEKFDLYKLLQISDVLISFYSTVSIEAMAFNVPIVNINWFKKGNLIAFGGDHSPVYSVDRREDLPNTVLEALKNREELKAERRIFLERYCGPSDGKSRERIFQLIREGLRHSERTKKIGAVIKSSHCEGPFEDNVNDPKALQTVISRLSGFFPKPAITVVTSLEPADDKIDQEAQKLGVRCFRLAYQAMEQGEYQAANQFEINPMIRIHDGLLEDGSDLADLIEYYRKSEADYAACYSRQIPEKIAAEIVSLCALRTAWHEGKTSEERKGITWYIRTHPKTFRIQFLNPRKRSEEGDSLSNVLYSGEFYKRP